MEPTHTPDPQTEHANADLQPLVELFLKRRQQIEAISPEQFANEHPVHRTALMQVLPLVLAYNSNDSSNFTELNSDPKLDRQDKRFPKIHDYLIEQEIGRGGMGIVYKAEQLALGRSVALKVLPSNQSNDDIAVQRFRREARSAAGLHHTNIVPVFEVGESGGNFYYAMQHIVGDGIDKIIKAMRKVVDVATKKENVAVSPTSEDLIFAVKTVAEHVSSKLGDESATKSGDLKTRLDDSVDDSAATTAAIEPNDLVKGADHAESTSEISASDVQDFSVNDAADASVELGIDNLRNGDLQSNEIDLEIETNNQLTRPQQSTDRFAKSLTGQTQRDFSRGTKADTLTGSTIIRNRSYFRNVGRIGLDVASALAYAHHKGIVHRDIKPSNLLMDIDGNLWVADFGLAKSLDDNLTQTGNVVGTFRYMAPERFEGINTPAGDIYALGATLYELASLKPAFTGTDSASLIEKIFNETPKSLRSIVPTIPIDLETIINKSMEKDPLRRYQTSSEFSDDLDCFINGKPISARRITLRERLGLWACNNKAIATLLSILFVGLLATTIAAGWAAYTYRDMANRQTELTQIAEDNAELAVNNAKQAEANAARHKGVSKLFLDSIGRARADRKGKEVTVYESLTDALPGIRETTNDDPGTSAALLASIARIFESLGVYDDYYDLSKEAYEIAMLQAGPENRDTLQYAIQVARGLTHLGREKDTFTLLNEIRGVPADSTQRLTIESMFGESLIKRHEIEKAIDVLLSAYIECEESDADSLGHLGWTTLSVLENLSIANQMLGKIDVAINYCEQVVERCIEVEGEDGFKTTYYRNSLMGLYYQDRRFAKVIPIMEKIAAGYVNELGEDHPYAITSYVNLATVNQAAGNLKKAIEICEANYGFAKARGTKSREFRYLSRVLAGMKLEAGDFDETVAIGWLKSIQTTDGFETPHEQAFVYSTLAELAIGRSDMQAAIKYAELGLSDRKKSKDPDHEYFSFCENILGHAKLLQKDQTAVEVAVAKQLLLKSGTALPKRLEKIRNTDHWKIQKALQRTIDFFESQKSDNEVKFWKAKLKLVESQIEAMKKNSP